MKIIGLGYRARNGKDTVAKAIHAAIPEHSVVMGFADELKAVARALGMQEKNGPFLQKLGEAMRTLDPDYWIQRVAMKLDELKPEVAIIPDVRYLNEFAWVSRNGGVLVKVCRLTVDGEPWIAKDRPADHPSECELDQIQDDAWNYVVRAYDGDLRRLKSFGHDIALSTGFVCC